MDHSDGDPELGLPGRWGAVPPPMQMKSHHVPKQSAVRTSKTCKVREVYFCFFVPMGAEPKSDLSRLVYRGLEWFKERYPHVECLFRMDGGNQEWIAFTVSEKEPVGIYARPPAWYRDGRWVMMKLRTVERERMQMWKFAVREAKRQRAYNHGGLITTVPCLSVACFPFMCCLPLCFPTMTFGPNTVFCAQLMCEMMQHVFPDDYRGLLPERVRPDRFFIELSARSSVAPSVMSVESGDATTVRNELLAAAGTDLWSRPNKV